MTTTFPIEVLCAQPRLWAFPELFVEVEGASGKAPDVREVANAVLRSLVDTVDVDHAPERLIQTGEFAAIDAAREKLRLSLGERTFTTLRLMLQTERERARNAAAETSLLLQARHGRLQKPIPEMERHLRDAVLLSQTSGPRARAALAALDAQVVAAEDAELAELEQRRARRFRKDGRLSPLDEAIQRAIRTRSSDVAAYLLTLEPATASLSALSLEPHRQIYTGNISPAQFAAWIRGQGRDLPQGFVRNWGVRDEDGPGQRLLRSVERFVTADLPPTQTDFTELVDAMESAAGLTREDDSPPISRAVSNDNGVWSTRLGKLPPGAIPGLSGSEYQDGLVVAYHAAAAASSDADDSQGDPPDPDDVTFDDEPEAESADRYYLRLGNRLIGRSSGRALQLDWRALLSLAGDPYRSVNFRRLIGRQIHPRDALPVDAPTQAADVLASRREIVRAMLHEHGEILWVGPAESGKSSILAALATLAADEARQVRHVRTLSDLHAIVEGAVADGGGDERRHVLLADDVGRLPAAEIAELVATMQLIHDNFPERVSCVCMADDELLRLRASWLWRRLPPMSHSGTAEVIRRLLDVTRAAYPDRTIVDRITYYCGGHPGLLRRFLYFLGSEGGSYADSWSITAASTEAVFARSGYQAAARTLLSRPLATEPSLQAVLGAVRFHALTASDRAGGATATELSRLLEDYGAAISAGDVERALLRLESAYLLSRRGDVWTLPENAIGHLMFDKDAEQYFEQSVEAVM